MFNIKNKNDTNKRRGFTLIELLVVMAIMGILTIITVSQFGTARKKARDVQRKGDLSSLQKALFIYYADYDEFPEYINNSDDNSCSDNSICSQTSEDWCDDNSCEFTDGTPDLEGIYMKVLPVENKSGIDPYCYVVSVDRKQFALYGVLENINDNDCKCVGECELDNSNFLFENKCGNDYCLIYASPNVNVNVEVEF